MSAWSWLKDVLIGSEPLPIDNMKEHRPVHGVRVTNYRKSDGRRLGEHTNAHIYRPDALRSYIRLDDGPDR